MKSLVWLLLAVVGTALVQVPPPDTAKAKTCCCHPGMCEMPGCGSPPPASALTALSSAPSVRAAKLPASRKAQAVRDGMVKSFALFVEPAAVRAALLASAEAAPAAAVPLFRAHCSLLI